MAKGALPVRVPYLKPYGGVGNREVDREQAVSHIVEDHPIGLGDRPPPM